MSQAVTQPFKKNVKYESLEFVTSGTVERKLI